MKNLYALFLLVGTAGWMQASVVYATSTGEAPTTVVNQQTLDNPYNSSSYGQSEPDGFVTAGTNYTWSIVSLDQGTDTIGGMGITKANYVSELFARYYPVFGAAIDQSTAGALQSSTLEIIRETAHTFDVSSGNLIFTNEGTPGMLAQAQSMLSALAGNGPLVNNVVGAASGNNAQDTMVQVSDGGQIGSQPADLATFGIAGFTLIGLGWVGRRRSALKVGV